MVIEWLKFLVKPELREYFVQQDEAIWTAALSQYPGFQSKEVWISPENLAEVVLVIQWETFEQWQAVPPRDLERIEGRFSEALGNTYEIVEAARYQIRKFA